ncbi:MAG: Mth938-like domain-containing protein [Alphaproteobacteria bacterium]|nr:Mth938-like domain-containing protein [Alphaproteobacteria bacterium]
MASDKTSETPPVYQVVESYGAARFRISGAVYDTSVLVFPERTVFWNVTRFEDLQPSDFVPILEAAETIEILLLGCGERMQLVTPDLRGPLRAAGVVIEPMDTGAAARTFNLLLSEDRRVTAALIALT